MNCRPGPKLQKVLGKDELCGVPLKEENKKALGKDELCGVPLKEESKRSADKQEEWRGDRFHPEV